MGKNVDLKGMYGVLYRDFINSFYSRLCDYRDVKYYDSSINRFTTEEDFIKSIKKSIEDGELFKLNLNIKASGGDSIPPEAKIV